MIDLKDYINESLLDDFGDMTQDQDELFSDPLMWLYDKTKTCKKWNQLIDILKEFKEFIDAGKVGTIIKRRIPAPKTGLYSKYWDLKTYNFGKSNMLCKFEFDINDLNNRSGDFDIRVLMIGCGKSNNSAVLCFSTTGVYWMIGGDITQPLVSNNATVYHIDPKSTFYKGYDDLFKKIK